MPGDLLDSAHSWLVAVSCSFMYFIIFGMSRISGLLFVFSITYYDSSRKAASFPFTLACALRNLGGPLGGYLAGILGIRFVILLGCVLSFVGVAACFIAENILMVNVFWGGFFGLGSSFSTSQLAQLNNLYFHKHLTKANGVSLAGAAISGIVLPPLVEFLLNKYGLPGTYLILSGLVLNSIPVGLLLKEPPEESSSKETKYMNNEVTEDCNASYTRKLSNGSLLYGIKTRHSMSMEYCSKCRLQGVTKPASNKLCRDYVCKNEMCLKRREYSNVYRGRNRLDCNALNNKVNGKNDNTLFFLTEKPLETNATNAPCKIIEVNSNSIQRSFKIEVPLKFPHSENHSKNTNSNYHNSEVTPEKEIYYIKCSEESKHQKCETKKGRSGLKNFDIFFNVQFLMINFTASIDTFFCFVIPSILNDLACDKGISLTNSTYLLMCMSITNLVGRLCLGWITDNGYLSIANFCALCFFIVTVSLVFLVWCNDLKFLFAIMCLMGLSSGAVAPLPACLITDYIHPDRHIIANSSLDILSVPFLFLTSTMIGYFRDELGSYDYLVYILCLLYLLCCAMLLALPYIKKRNSKTKFVIFGK